MLNFAVVKHKTEKSQMQKDKNVSYKNITKIIPVMRTDSILGDSRNFMLPILVPSSAKRIATQILVIAKLNGRKDFILTVFVCYIIHPNKKLSVQS